MQYHDIELRPRESDGKRVVEVDGYHHVHPESKPGEYRRIAIGDLTEEQVRVLHEELGEIIAEWDAGASTE